MEPRSTGLLIIGLGIAAIVVGALVWLGALSWFGRLPGDVRFESGSTRVYFPIVSMLLVSLVASLVLALLRRIL